MKLRDRYNEYVSKTIFKKITKFLDKKGGLQDNEMS